MRRGVRGQASPYSREAIGYADSQLGLLPAIRCQLPSRLSH
jgi:hypothetical protein